MDHGIVRMQVTELHRVVPAILAELERQGIALTDKPAFSFQGHPEASPGPHDLAYLFDRFVAMMERPAVKEGA